MATKIGCDNLVYALLIEDTATSATWGEVEAAPGVISININPNAATETLFYDDGPGESAATLGAIEVEIEKNALTTQQKADLLGHSVDDKGGLVYGAQDTPPWVAIGFRTLKSNGKYRYVWLYKGKFMEPSDENQTKGDGIEFNTDTITGSFVKLERKYKVGGEEIQPWKYEIDEEDEGVDSDVIANWFNEVIEPSTTVQG